MCQYHWRTNEDEVVVAEWKVDDGSVGPVAAMPVGQGSAGSHGGSSIGECGCACVRSCSRSGGGGRIRKWQSVEVGWVMVVVSNSSFVKRGCGTPSSFHLCRVKLSKLLKNYKYIEQSEHIINIAWLGYFFFL